MDPSTVLSPEIVDLGLAIGLLRDTASTIEFDSDWIADPGPRLSTALADEARRDALIRFVDSVNGDGGARDEAGITYLRVFDAATMGGAGAPNIVVEISIDDRADTYVEVGVAVAHSTTDPIASRTSLTIPLYRTGKRVGGSVAAVAEPFALAAGSAMRLTSAITIGDGQPDANGFGLAAIDMTVLAPVTGPAGPSIEIMLRGLRMPGSTAPIDVAIGGPDSTIEDALVSLVLGAVQAGASTVGGPGGDALMAMLDLIGLGTTPTLPALDIGALAQQGVAALRAWFTSAMDQEAVRQAWLDRLGDVLGGNLVGDELVVPIAGSAVELRLGVAAAPGPSGHLRVTPRVGVALAASLGAGPSAVSVAARAAIDVLTFDLADGTLIAVPRADVFVEATGALGARLLATGPVQIGSVRTGISVIGGEVAPLLSLLDVVAGGSAHPVIDLSSADAVVASAGELAGELLGAALDALGPTATHFKVLLGLDPPAGMPALDVGQLLTNPLVALGTWWRELVTTHAARATEVLSHLRDLVAADDHLLLPVSGDGTAAHPWSIAVIGGVSIDLWHEGATLVIAPTLGFRVDSLGGGCTVITTALRTELAAIDLDNGTVNLMRGASLSAGIRGRGLDHARLSLGSVAVIADEIRVSADWSPSAGFGARLAAPGLAADLGELSTTGAPIPLILPTVGDWQAATAGSIEQLVGVLAATNPSGWLHDLVDLFGWQLGEISAHRLSLAATLGDPAAELARWATSLATDGDLLSRLTTALARLFTGDSAGRAGALSGRGTPTDPWMLPLGSSATAPALTLALAPSGPTVDASQTTDALRTWLPGVAGLGASGLAQAILDEAGAGDDTSALARGRAGTLDVGLAAVANRVVGTDVLVAPPPAAIAGLEVVPHPGRVWSDWDGVPTSTVLGGAPAATTAVIRVTLGRTLPATWTGVPADRIVDLSAPGLAPESFTVNAPAAGEWFVLLAGRADASLGLADPSGVLGQAARLRRIIAGLGAARPVILIASGGAGHAARVAADAEPSVERLVTLGSPWSAVAFETARSGSSADALRLLRALLPAVDPTDPDDADLAVGRAIVEGLRDADRHGEIEAPRPELTIRAGLAATAWFGALDRGAVDRALTAVVAAGLAARARARFPVAAAAPTSAEIGLHLPIPPGTSAGGLTVDGSVTFGLTGSGFATGSVSASPSVAVHLVVARAEGWLVGGPGTTPAGGALPLEARFVEFRATFGIDGQPSTAEVIIHEVNALGAYRDRIVVRPDATIDGTIESLPFLPEARAVLAAVVDELRTAAVGTAPATLAALCDTVGLSVPTGLVPDALSHLLHDPAAYASQILASATTRESLLDAAVGLLPGAARTGQSLTITHSGDVTASVSIDLLGRTVGLSASSTSGALPWSATMTGLGTGSPAGSITIGDRVADAAALRLGIGPFSVGLVSTDAAGGPSTVGIWPTADLDGIRDLAVAALPAEAVRLLIGAVRGLDASVATVVDALSGALGLLGAADVGGRRRVIAPVVLFKDPARWFRGLLGGTPSQQVDRVVDLFEAIKPFVGFSGTERGVWPIIDGVRLEITAGTTGATVSVAIDPAMWLGGAARAPFAAGISVGLTITPNGPPTPSVAVHVGLPEAIPSEDHRRAVHITLDDGVLRAFLRPTAGADIALHPNPAGLGALFAAGVDALLPMVLDEVAALTGTTERDQIGRLVSAVGRGLDIVVDPNNSAIRATFDATKLHDLAQDPIGHLTAQASALLVEVVTGLAPLISQLPGAPNASMVAGNLVVVIGGVTVTLDPSPLSVTVVGEVSGLPFIDIAAAGFTVDASGLRAWDLAVGPANFNLGGPTIRPVLRGGRAGAAGWEIIVGLGLDDLDTGDDGHRELIGRWREIGGLALVARTRTGGVDVDVTDPLDIALFAADATLELLGTWLLAITEIGQLLDTQVGPSNRRVRQILQGSLLSSTDDHAIKPGVVSSLPGSLFVLARNLVANLPAVPIGPFELGLNETAGVIGLRVNIADAVGRNTLELNPGAEVVVALETDSAWIAPPSGVAPAPGIVIDLVSIGAGDQPTVEVRPGIAVNGVGVRISSSSGPLLDAGLRVDSVAVHLFGSLAPSGSGVAASGGVEVEITGLAVPISGGGGSNAVAQGVVNDAGGSGAPPAPTFSPGLAIQHHAGTNGVAVSLSAGPGEGPWYLPIQRAFGPVYIEQVGLETTHSGSPPATPRTLATISLSIDGSVSLFGLTASVDKLRLTYHVSRPFFEVTSWDVDLDGFAIASDVGGLSLVGALRKAPLSPPLEGVEYLGMLKIGFGGYGLDLFGGYAHPTGPQGSFASFFAFGALHAPLGGPPAFFVTGIGLGFGINRELLPPTMENLTTNPFMVAMKALGPAPEPMAQLEQMRTQIKPAQGQYWVAAGISFTSFVLISGEVVVTVAFGDGLDIAVLGLARAELPSPGATLVSIELGLIARFSTKEGTVLIAAQLTENSWLLHPSVRLTGGFAFQTWWKGPNAGQFVVTLGGYHPDFSHAGYPQVPRLGLSWQVASNISIVGESYFALCSEALMAGTSMEVSAKFGPAYASLSYGADGIVFFDPFWFKVSAWAEVRAGIRIWVLFGTIDVELSLGVWVEITGPPIHVEGRFEICGFEVPFEFGDEGNPADNALSATAFRDKYLRASSDAQVIKATVTRGATTSGQRADGGQQKVPDGSALNPFLVIPEFELVVFSTAPVIDMVVTHDGVVGRTLQIAAPELGVAPMYSDTLASTLTAELDKLSPAGGISLAAVNVFARPLAAFPKGVWGEAPNPQSPAIPAGDIIKAADGFTISTVLADPAGAPAIDYHQVELPFGGRKPLPFVTNTVHANARVAAATALQQVADEVRTRFTGLDGRYLAAARLLDGGGYGPVGVAALRGERAAPPAFGSLADDMVKTPKVVATKTKAVIVDRSEPVKPFVAPIVKAVMSTSASAATSRAGSSARTTVADPGKSVRRTPPTLESMRSAVAFIAPAALVIRNRTAVIHGQSMLAAGNVPMTRIATSPLAAVANAAPTSAAMARLETMSAALFERGAVLHDGEIAVVTVASRAADGSGERIRIAGGTCRVIALAAGGNVLLDNASEMTGRRGLVDLTLPTKTERVVVMAIGDRAGIGGGVEGWYAGQTLPMIGWDLAVGAGVVVRFADHKTRNHADLRDGGWANTRDLVAASAVTTRFDAAVRSVAVAIDDVTARGVPDAASLLDIRLVGATRELDKRGEPIPPMVVVEGLRSVLVYGVVPDGLDGSGRDPNVLVIVESTRDGHLAGVAGSTDTSAALIEAITSVGFDAAIGSPIAGGTGVRTIRWISAAQRQSVRRPRPRTRPPRRTIRSG